MLPEKYTEGIDEMRDSEEKELLKVLKESDAQPYVRNCDGYAAKMKEDKEITYTDYDKNERVLKVPKGDYIIIEAGCSYPKAVTAEDFEMKNKITGDKKEDKKSKKKRGPGIEMAGGYSGGEAADYESM